VDEHGHRVDFLVLDILVQERRNADAAGRFFWRLLDRVGEAPDRIVTDKLASYAVAKDRIPALDAVRHTYVARFRAGGRPAKQSRGAVPPADPLARTAEIPVSDATLQVRLLRPAVPVALQPHA
jgi:hypothetical protein